MKATDALRAALRDVVSPAARAAGFKGSGNTWRSTNSAGDVAVVNVQSSMYSSAASARCTINIAVAPAPWLDLATAHRGRPLKSVNQSDGLYRDRVHPTGTPPRTDAWWVVTSAEDAHAVAHDMVDQLNTQAGFPRLRDLLRRDRLLECVRAGDLGFTKKADLDPAYGDWYFSRAEAVLLADEGPSARLHLLLDVPDQLAAPSEQQSGFDFASWIRGRAQRQTVTTRQVQREVEGP